MKKILLGVLLCLMLVVSSVPFAVAAETPAGEDALEVEKITFHAFRPTNGDVYFDFYFNADDIEPSGDNYLIGREYISATSSEGTPADSFSATQFAEGGSNVVRIFVRYGTSEDIVSITIGKGFAAGSKTMQEDYVVTFYEPVTMETPGGTTYQPNGRLDDRAWTVEEDKEGIACYSAVFMQFHYVGDEPIYFAFGLYMAGDLFSPGDAWNAELNPYSTEIRGYKDGEEVVAHAELDGLDRYYSKIVRLYVPISEIDKVTSITVRAGLDIRTSGKELKQDITFTVPDGVKIAVGEKIGGEDKDWIRLNYVYESEYTNVLFYDIEQNLIRVDRVKKGESVTPPEAPEVSGYRFTGWSVTDLSSVTEPTHVYAQYEPVQQAGCSSSAGGAQYVAAPLLAALCALAVCAVGQVLKREK